VRGWESGSERVGEISTKHSTLGFPHALLRHPYWRFRFWRILQTSVLDSERIIFLSDFVAVIESSCVHHHLTGHSRSHVKYLRVEALKPFLAVDFLFTGPSDESDVSGFNVLVVPQHYSSVVWTTMDFPTMDFPTIEPNCSTNIRRMKKKASLYKTIYYEFFYGSYCVSASRFGSGAIFLGCRRVCPVYPVASAASCITMAAFNVQTCVYTHVYVFLSISCTSLH